MRFIVMLALLPMVALADSALYYCQVSGQPRRIQDHPCVDAKHQLATTDNPSHPITVTPAIKVQSPAVGSPEWAQQVGRSSQCQTDHSLMKLYSDAARDTLNNAVAAGYSDQYRLLARDLAVNCTPYGL